MPHARPPALTSTAAALVAAALACSTAQRASAERKAADILIPREQEQQLGLQVKQQLEQQEHVQYVEDPQVNGYVQEVAGRILAQAKKDRPDVTWTVKVINDPKTVNAFATPGGYLYVYSGLLLAADDTSEVAGVLGHESGHVVARHSARQMVDAFGLEGLAALALGKNPGGIAQLAAGLAGKTSMLAFSRSDEAEADTYGVRYAAAAGYDPHGIARFFEKLAKAEGKQPGWAAFLSDHPLTPDRIQKVNAYIAQHHLDGGAAAGTGSSGAGGDALAAIKERIRKLPPPPPKPQEQPGGQQPGPSGAPGQSPGQGGAPGAGS